MFRTPSEAPIFLLMLLRNNLPTRTPRAFRGSAELLPPEEVLPPEAPAVSSEENIEAPPPPAPEVPITEVVEPVSSDAEDLSPPSSFFRGSPLLFRAHASEILTDTSSATLVVPFDVSSASLPELPPSPEEEDAIAPYLFEILYSFDGEVWQRAFSVREAEVRRTPVSFPIQSWDELAELQINIRVLAPLPPDVELYLDGVVLAVEYEIPPGPVEQAIQEIFVPSPLRSGYGIPSRATRASSSRFRFPCGAVRRSPLCLRFSPRRAEHPIAPSWDLFPKAFPFRCRNPFRPQRFFLSIFVPARALRRALLVRRLSIARFRKMGVRFRRFANTMSRSGNSGFVGIIKTNTAAPVLFGGFHYPISCDFVPIRAMRFLR